MCFLIGTVSKVSNVTHGPLVFCRGDIVILKNPYRPTGLVCKRVVGMEQDKITKEDGKVITVIVFSYIYTDYIYSLPTKLMIL